MKTYTEVAQFPSSNYSKTYTVKRDEEGALSCDCPAWTFKKQAARTCKHVQQVERGEGIVAQMTAETKERVEEARGGSLAEILERVRRADERRA